jgi:glyoxylase-like metal-dependent hydrolase (beta-lactamase superfamily II)
MIVRQLEVGTMKNFVYLLADVPGGEALVVDSGWETEPIVNSARELKVKVKFAVATHNHFDHTSSLRDLANTLGARVVVHKDSPIEHDISVTGGDKLQIGSAAVEVIHTPGHTKDSICLYDGRHLFTGDTLFIGNCGRTDLPGGDVEEMYRSLHDVILKLPHSTVIYPGHDYGDAPFRELGEEAQLNPTLSSRSLAEFLMIP